MTRLKMLTAATLAATLMLPAENLFAQTTGAAAKTKAKKHKETETERELRELNEKLKAQQAQIDALNAQLAGKSQEAAASQQAATQAQQQAVAAQAAADQANTAAATAQAKTDQVSSSLNDLKATDAGLQETVINNQKNIQESIDSPSAIHYKGVTFTPVAFFAAEGIYRQRAVNADVNTPLNSIPFPGANQGHVSELNFSGRQSRLGLLVESKPTANLKLSGYFEGDFLGVGTSSNNNQSNSYVFRQRQFWARAENSTGLAFTGGQMWSLVTEDGKGADVRTEKLPATVDAQYIAGFSWARQAAFRVSQRFGDYKTGAITLAASLEQAQITNFTATSNVSAAVPTNFFFAGAGQNGGLYNAFNGNYANNVAPDVLVKIAADVPWGHFELGGIARFLRDYYYPVLSTGGTAAAPTYTYASTYVSNTKTGGGIFGSARVTPIKYVDLSLQLMAGTGVGRYGSAQLADATIHPDGTLAPIKNYHGLAGIETHPYKNFDINFYYGGEYAKRTIYTTAQGDIIGYGSPLLVDQTAASTPGSGCYAFPANPGSSTGGSISAGNCNSPTKYIQEGVLGFTYRAYNSPKYGRLQFQATYSYLQRQLWAGTSLNTAITPVSPRALDGMVATSMRYYIP